MVTLLSQPVVISSQCRTLLKHSSLMLSSRCSAPHNRERRVPSLQHSLPPAGAGCGGQVFCLPITGDGGHVKEDRASNRNSERWRIYYTDADETTLDFTHCRFLSLPIEDDKDMEKWREPLRRHIGIGWFGLLPSVQPSPPYGRSNALPPPGCPISLGKGTTKLKKVGSGLRGCTLYPLHLW